MSGTKRLAWVFLVIAVVVDPIYYFVPRDFRPDFIWHCSVLAIVYASLTLLRQEQIAEDPPPPPPPA